MDDANALTGLRKKKKTWGQILKRKKLKRNNINAWKRHIFQRQKGRCWYCKRICRWNDQPVEGETLEDDLSTVDHLLPLAAGGSSRRGNLVGCCRACNREKGSVVLPESLIGRVRHYVQFQPRAGAGWKPWVDPERPLLQAEKAGGRVAEADPAST